MNTTLATLRFLFATPQRGLVTVVIMIMAFGIINPDFLHSVTTAMLEKFWLAFGPLFWMILHFLAFLAGCALMIWVIRKGTGWGESSKKNSPRRR
jgi:hypothetical protein